MKRFIDRTTSLTGLDKTTRDSRVPFSSVRAIDNFYMPDARAYRRRGYKPVDASVKTQALAKTSGVSILRRTPDSQYEKNFAYVTPLSYGVIRWQDDYQLRRSANKTIEFMFRVGDKEELVVSPFDRLAQATLGAWWANYTMRTGGVYLIDQTITSNWHKFHDGQVSKGGVLSAGTVWNLDQAVNDPGLEVFPLTTFAVKYTETQLKVSMMLFNTASSYYVKCEDLVYSFGASYQLNSIYHVAIVHNTAGTVKLYVNGVLADTFTLPAGFVFVGEQDVINGITYATGQKRDIVLLNESVCRGSYSSACNLNRSGGVGVRTAPQGYYHAYSIFASNTQPVPWCCSPPKGTAMWDLRIWTEDKAATIATLVNKRILPSDSNITQLKGNWYLNDGGPVCVNNVTSLEKRYCSIHHSYPGYVDETVFLNKRGLKLGDGQHLILRTNAADSLLGRGLQSKLEVLFNPDVSVTATDLHQDQHSFTVQMQVMVPDALQPEINDTSAVAADMRDMSLAKESRKGINPGGAANSPYDLRDGLEDTGLTNRQLFGHPTDAVTPARQSARAFDQTLWSIEGTQKNVDSPGNEPDTRRIPVARGLVSPTGKVVFELYKMSNPGAGVGPPNTQPQYCRLVTAASLTPGQVYSVTFVQRCLYQYDAGTNSTITRGWQMEIWVKNLTTNSSFVLDSQPFVIGSQLLTASCPHAQNYDVSIGASYVNDSWDWSNRATTVSPLNAGTSSSSANPRGQHAPFPITQRFMTPYQDQPGNIVVGVFRVWSAPLPPLTIAAYSANTLVSSDYTPDLLINLEFDSITGTKVKSQCRYEEVFEMGFKGWGQPAVGEVETTPTLTNLYLFKEKYEGAWVHQSCLGYIPIKDAFDARGSQTSVNGLAQCKTSKSDTFGTIAVFGDSIGLALDSSKLYLPGYISTHGLLSDFSQGAIWRSVMVGDRTFLTSIGGLPKVFDGKSLNLAGFGKWTGGNVIAYQTFGSATTTLAAGWYGVVAVYRSETHAIKHVSPVATLKLSAASTITIINQPPHPDNRVAYVEYYRTQMQVTRDLALSAPLIKCNPVRSSSNAFYWTTVLDEADAALAGRPILDRNVTEVPEGAYCAAFNGRLYIGGDPLNPDNVYISDSGNPETFDSLFNFAALLDGSGDLQTGLVSAFNTVLVFKPSGIWRIDEVASSQFRATKISSIGALAESSIVVVFDPDTGRELVFYWSQYGPHIFDGSNTQYVGAPLEESIPPKDASDAGILTQEYFWLDLTTVVSAVNLQRREIICYYKPVKVIDGILQTYSRRSEAVVYNFRSKTWSHYTGMIGDVALTTSLVQANPPFVTGKSSDIQRNTTYQLLVGAYNGYVYNWDTSAYDGIPADYVLDVQHTISTLTGNVLDLDGDSGNDVTSAMDLTGVWVTIVDPTTNEYFSTYIVDNATRQITISDEFHQLWPTWTKLWKVYIGFVPAFIEFPWDELEMPFADKQLIEIIAWVRGSINYRYSQDYNEATEGPWTLIPTKESQRQKIQINKRSDAFKLKLMSLDTEAAIDALAYRVHYTQDGNTKQ